jgi:glycosyltransferase involved in cell wall biosynthesis
VLFVGRLQARKRVDNLLRACSDLPGSLQPDLWIIGEGPAAADLRQLAQQVYPAARFPGAVHGKELEAYFLKADLFVLPGTGGLAVQQAMAFGLPVIVAEGDGTQSDLVSPDNGWLIPNADVYALRTALEQALSRPQHLPRMGYASYRIVRDEVNLEIMVNRFIQALLNTTVRVAFE